MVCNGAESDRLVCGAKRREAAATQATLVWTALR